MARQLTRRSQSGGFLRRAVYGAGVLARNAPGIMQTYRSARSMFGGASRKQASSGRVASITPGVITTQHDVAGRYRRKAMPRRRRQAWKAFSHKVKHVVLQMGALRSLTNDNYNRVISWAAGAQNTFGQMLGGVNCTDNDEMLAMFKAVYGAALSVNTIDRFKLFIKSLCLDIQLRNTGSQGAIVDVYTLICRTSDKAGNRIEVSYVNAFNEQATSLIGSLTVANPATTPFQNPLFTSMWKIISKKEILLGAGQVTTMQMRLPYNKMFYGKKLENNEQAVPGFTRAYLFQARGVPVNSSGTPELAAGELVIAGQITGSYAVPPDGGVATTGQL